MAFKTIYVKTTDTCNLHCDHCFTSGRNGKKGFFDVEATQKWVNDYMENLGDQHNYHIELHGGEPFLAPMSMLKEFVAPYTGAKNISIGACTNLVYKLTDEKIEFIRNELNSNIATSWDNGIRFDTEAQEKLWFKNVDRLNEEGIPFKLQVSISKSVTDMDVNDFLDIMERINPATISLERITAAGNVERNRSVVPDNEDQDLWHLALYKAYKKRPCSFRIGTLDTIDTKLKYNVVKTDTNCRNCEQHLATISADGHLSGCPNAAQETNFGTIHEDSVAFMSNGNRKKEIVHELDFHPNCLSCDVFDICGGDCHRLSWQGDRCAGLKHLLRYVRNGGNQIPALQIG